MIRIQRRRTKGWRMPPGTIFVGRPGPWANPFRIGEMDPLGRIVVTPEGVRPVGPMTRGTVVACYRRWLAECILERPALLAPLSGRDVACWCRDDQLCHGDVLIEARLARSPTRWARLQLGATPILPEEGERLTFGVHRQTEPDAETAPAWAPVTEASRVATFKREQAAFARAQRRRAS